MNLLERYVKGDMPGVYEEIERMGSDAFKKGNLREVNAVLKETMMRVRYNLGTIYAALNDINYCFRQHPKHDFEYPLLKPRWPVGFRIARMERAARALGYMPLSLKMFYKIVGSCNFGWDYEFNRDIPWIGADPIQVGPVTDLLAEVKDLEPDGEPIGIPISADCYHKDNISGGPPYSVELTSQPQVDSLLLWEEHETSFIDYLRLTFEGGGFSRPEAVMDLPDFVAYLSKVKPLLKPI
jgi:hypothetical protein